MPCGSCGVSIPVVAKFCPECGARPESTSSATPAPKPAGGQIACFQCKSSISAAAKFCPNCGAAPDQASLAPVEAEPPSQSGMKCKGCGRSFDTGSYITALGAEWHQGCFACGQCKKPITSSSFAVSNGHPLCESCVEKAKKDAAAGGGRLDTGSESLTCTGCRKPITTRYVKPDGKPFHAECFVCANGCGANLMQGYVEKNGRYVCGSCVTKPSAAPAAPTPAQASSGGGAKPSGVKGKFCGECGAPGAGGKFCGECGATY